MIQDSINKLPMSELISYRNILDQKMGQMDFARDRNVAIDLPLYEILQEKRHKVNERIDHLVGLL